jgi:2-polyprenyl-6-methoxyphenol hydroxylase-like FAD-dependent oxidoreductase
MVEKPWDVAVVGAGPAGLFAARELAGKLSVVVLDEKGRTGGAGAMTDGKLNLSPHIGLDLYELQMAEEEAVERIEAVDRGSGSTPGSTGSPGSGARLRRGSGTSPFGRLGNATWGRILPIRWWPG